MDDMMAYALNHLKPIYCTSVRGRVFGKYSTKDPQNRMDIYRVLVNAIEMVCNNRHL